MCSVVVMALTAEGFSAAFNLTVRAGQSAAVCTRSYRTLATRGYVCGIARRVLDLGEWNHQWSVNGQDYAAFLDRSSSANNPLMRSRDFAYSSSSLGVCPTRAPFLKNSVCSAKS